MRMLKSFVLRIILILSLTGTVSLLLMALTLGIQQDQEGLVFCGTLFGILLLWVGINAYVVKKVDPELSVEVARLLIPSGAVLSIFLSYLLAMILDDMIPGTEGKQHWIVLFVGLGVAFFLFIRWFDIKWLRAEDEILNIEERSR
ncbi:hypothetical protein [Oceanipulchritudo coccoides]|nr:hypothetical protein [Oceanipulchritudo coccoides]